MENINKSKKSKVIIILLLLLLLIIAGIFYFFFNDIKTAIDNYRKEKIVEIAKDLEFNSKNEFQIKARIVPGNYYIESQFICQAPLETEENWKYHEESCEEAALLQSYLNETGKTMTKEEANEEILKMIEWQNKNFGGHQDIYADKVKQLAIKYFKVDENQVHIVENASILDLQTILSKDHTIIVPVTSKYLKNPYYEYPGYHMIQVIGYTEDKIITNDNGTRRGKDYNYDIADFEKAMKDAGANIVYFTIKAEK